MSNPTISIDTSKVLTAGTHFKFTEPSNLVILQKYLVYTTSGKIDTFQTVQLEKTVLTKSLIDLNPAQEYIIQLVIETASSTLQSNSLSFIATAVSQTPVIQSVVPIDNAVIVNLGFNSNNGSNLTEAKFTLSDGSSIFTIKKTLNNFAPSQFILSENITNYKSYELAVSVKNERGYSSNTQAVAFEPSDIPNAPVLGVPVESDSKVALSWNKPSDYNEWSVESYSAIVHIEYKKQSVSTWETIELDVKENQLTNYDIGNLDNGSLYEFKMKYQNDNGMGVYSSVRTAIPHRQADHVQTHIYTVEDGMISISANKTPLNGLPLKHYKLNIFDSNEQLVKSVIHNGVLQGSNWFSFQISRVTKNNMYETLVEELVIGQNYKFEIFAVTQSSDANMTDELVGTKSSVNATYFEGFPTMSPISLVAGDSQMSMSWSALSDFVMPVKELKYDVLMNDLVIESGLENLEFVKSGLVNGDVNNFVVRSNFKLTEDPREVIYTVASSPATLSAFKAPDAPSSLNISDLGSTSLTLSWSAGALNGTKHSKYRVYDGDVMLKEVVTESASLTELTKGRDYDLSVVTVSTRDELIGQTFVSEKSSVRTTRPYSTPSKVRTLATEVLDRSLKITWDEPIDFGGYSLSKYRLMYIPKINDGSHWKTVDDVQSGVVLSGLENGKEYQIVVIVNTFNTELQLNLNCGGSTVYGKPLSVSTMPRDVQVVDMDGSFRVSWNEPETDNGSSVTSFKLHVLNQNTQMTQIVTLDASLREKIHVATNGIKYFVSLTAMNSVGESPKSPGLEAIPFGSQSVNNVSIVGQTVSWSVNVNGRKVDDISVLAIDSSPDVNENLFLSSPNQDDVIVGSQSFSKTFDFNHSVQKYLIVVRSTSGQIVSTNFNM